jgi:hypothetical protein
VIKTGFMDEALFIQTTIGADYLKHQAAGEPQPSIDCFLDFFNEMKGLRATTMDVFWIQKYDAEIDAIKEILKRETK